MEKCLSDKIFHLTVPIRKSKSVKFNGPILQNTTAGQDGEAIKNPVTFLLPRGFHASGCLSLLPVASGTGAIAAASARTETSSFAETSSRAKGLDLGLLFRGKDLEDDQTIVCLLIL